MYTQPVRGPFPSLDALKAELDGYRPLPPDVMRKFTEKVRLDWNYHSNALEGNTLSYGETKALLLSEFHIGNKRGRDYMEMKAHDDVITIVADLVKDETPITGTLIRELHRLMLKEPYFNPAIDQFGRETEKRIVPGVYKTTPNSVRRPSGALFEYAQPYEVEAMMGELLEEYKRLDTEGEVHAVALATWFHYEFIRIHPFDDGNGRMARILMNLILQRKGLVPAIVLVKDKGAYLDALALTDGTDHLADFTAFISKQVERVMELEIRAAKGEDIAEPDDWKKELDLIKIQKSHRQVLLHYGQVEQKTLQLWLTGIILAVDELKVLFAPLFFDSYIILNTFPLEEYDIDIEYSALKSQLSSQTHRIDKSSNYQFKLEFVKYIYDNGRKDIRDNQPVMISFGESSIIVSCADYQEIFYYDEQPNSVTFNNIKNYKGSLITKELKQLEN